MREVKSKITSQPEVGELLRGEPRYKSKRIEAWAAALESSAEEFAKREKRAITLLRQNSSVLESPHL